MSKRATAVVVGGGILGSAVAYWLVLSGWHVRLFEAGRAGDEGATGRSGGMLRSVDFDPLLLRLSAAGTAVMQRWVESGLPGPSPVTPAPLWWLLDDEHARLWQGLPAQPVLHAAPVRLFRTTRTDLLHPDLAGCAAPWVLHDPSGAVSDVRAAVRQLLDAARRGGAEIVEHTALRITHGTEGRLALAGEDGRSVQGDWSVLATGRAALAQGLAGSGLHQRTVPQVRVTGLGTWSGSLIDQPSGTYLRPLAPGSALVGWSGSAFDGDRPPATALDEGPDKVAALCRSLGWRVQARIVGCVDAADAYTPDCRPRVDWNDASCSCVATGLSGRGFKFAVLMGAAIAHALCARAGAGDPSLLPAEAAQAAHWLGMAGTPREADLAAA